MPDYKAIVTLTWRFNCDDPHLECLEKAKTKLEKILETNPRGEEFEGFTVQVDLARMKSRKRLTHLAEFSPEEVFPYITIDDAKREYVVQGVPYLVRMNSHRYHVFRDNPSCVACGIRGTKLMLDINPGDQSPHFNLYAEENGRLVLMTKDHVLARSKGGRDEFANFATLCSLCNNLKGAYKLEYGQVRELRLLYNNSEMLPRKELRELINKKRLELAGEG